MTNIPRTISNAEVLELSKQLSVSPSDYTKPIRLYCDVDGVIKPSLREKEDFDRFLPVAVEIDVLPPYDWRDPVELLKGKFYWDAEVIERLATLSRSPLVDFVWLTDWRVSAPHALDKLLGIESIGYLDWERKFSDYAQSFKRVAIQEEQLESPSKFIWLDDRANLAYGSAPHVFAEENDDFEIKFDEEGRFLIEDNAKAYIDVIPASRYLNITTQPRQGLTMAHMDEIEAWVKENSGELPIFSTKCIFPKTTC